MPKIRYDDDVDADCAACCGTGNDRDGESCRYCNGSGTRYRKRAGGVDDKTATKLEAREARNQRKLKDF